MSGGFLGILGVALGVRGPSWMGFGMDFGVCARPGGVYGRSRGRSLRPNSVGKPRGRPKIKKNKKILKKCKKSEPFEGRLGSKNEHSVWEGCIF